MGELIDKDKVLELLKYWKHIEAYDKIKAMKGEAAMATYSQLTGAQESTIEWLFNRAKNIKKQIQNDEEADIKYLESKLAEISKEIDKVYSARDRYDKYIQYATYFIEKAEQEKKEWGF